MGCRLNLGWHSEFAWLHLYRSRKHLQQFYLLLDAYSSDAETVYSLGSSR